MTGHNPFDSPSPDINRPDKDNQAFDKKALFLDLLGESSNVSKSAEGAGIATGKVYKMRREDPEFARQWLAALWEGYTHLEMEVLRRLREGDLQAEDGSKYDFANSIRLLTAHRENAAKAQSVQRNVTAAEVRASIDRKVEAIRKQISSDKKRRSSLTAGQSA